MSAAGTHQMHDIVWLGSTWSVQSDAVVVVDAALREADRVPAEADSHGRAEAWGEDADQIVQFGGEIGRPRPPCAVDLP